ncbi:MAG: ribbon-helix-helix domain-containing protein [Pseudomonadota bacterium]
MPTVSFTTRIDADLKAKLDAIAKAEDRSASYIANRAIEAALEERDAFNAQIDRAVARVEKGETIPAETVFAWMRDQDAGEAEPFPKPTTKA